MQASRDRFAGGLALPPAPGPASRRADDPPDILPPDHRRRVEAEDRRPDGVARANLGDDGSRDAVPIRPDHVAMAAHRPWDAWPARCPFPLDLRAVAGALWPHDRDPSFGGSGSSVLRRSAESRRGAAVRSAVGGTGPDHRRLSVDEDGGRRTVPAGLRAVSHCRSGPTVRRAGDAIPLALLWLLVALTALGPAAMQIFVPALPAIRDGFGVATATAQLAFSLSTLAMAVTTLFAGSLSDGFGRRPVVLGGLLLFLLGTLVCLLAPDIGWLIAGRIVQAAGGATGFVLTRAMVRDLFGREDSARVIAYLTMAMVVAPMLAPALGGWLTDTYGWRAIFVAGMAAGLQVSTATVLGLPETSGRVATPGPGTGMLATMRHLLGLARFRGYALQGACSMALFFAFLAGAPFFVVETLGEQASAYGLAFILVSASFMAGNGTTARLTPHVGLDRMIAFGSWTVLLAVGCALVWHLVAEWSLLALFLPMAIAAFAQGLAMPNAQAGAVGVDPRAAGAASGLAGFLQMAAAAACAQLVGSLPHGTPWPMLAVMLACAVGMVAPSGTERAALAPGANMFSVRLARREDFGTGAIS